MTMKAMNTVMQAKTKAAQKGEDNKSRERAYHQYSISLTWKFSAFQVLIKGKPRGKEKVQMIKTLLEAF